MEVSLNKIPQFPPSITIEVDSTLPNMEILEIAISEAMIATHFTYFKLDVILAATMDYGSSMISYDVIKSTIDVNKLIYRRWL